MLAYRLDDLGWYQFEWLIQGLLKSELGLGVEAWSSNRGDEGKDAYFDGPLVFPAKHQNAGPFVFQVKFVENASAPGAKPLPNLRAAVRKEMARIRARRDSGAWLAPAHYALLTNVPLEPEDRASIKAILVENAIAADCTVLAATDVCNLVDAHPGLRRSYPQLLSLKDLDHLLAAAVARELVERSKAAVAAGRDVVRAYVPTSAYERTWAVLRKENMAVLYGPPEMGKSAIAWMVALAQLSQGWDALLCQSPADVFKLLSSERSQVFIADDAFGRTEYDPSATSLWEKDLPFIVPRLDQKHWLILTSRKHLLERARQAMDLQGAARQFPTPSAVLVDAGKLSKIEKALILYRHAKIGCRSDLSQSAIVRHHALEIVSNESFTPERIRRFVSERLPELVAARAEAPDLAKAIGEAIKNPTKAMRLAFRALDAAHKWFLVSLLEAGGYWARADEVQKYYEQHCPPERRIAFSQIHDQLLEAFVRWADDQNRILCWIHPSCRDLVIDELTTDTELRRRFLKTASVAGIRLAISTSGGSAGERNYPLMVGQESWRDVSERIAEIAAGVDARDAAALLTSFRESIIGGASENTRAKMKELLFHACEEFRKAWNTSRSRLSASDLEAYSEATLLLSPLPEVPDLSSSWDAIQADLDDALEEADEEVFDHDVLVEWLEFAEAVGKSQPRFLEQRDFRKQGTRIVDRCVELGLQEADADVYASRPSELREESTRLTEVASAFKRLSKSGLTVRPEVDEIVVKLTSKAERLARQADEEDEPEDDSDRLEALRDDFDVRLIFSDL